MAGEGALIADSESGACAAAWSARARAEAIPPRYGRPIDEARDYPGREAGAVNEAVRAFHEDVT